MYQKYIILIYKYRYIDKVCVCFFSLQFLINLNIYFFFHFIINYTNRANNKKGSKKIASEKKEQSRKIKNVCNKI